MKFVADEMLGKLARWMRLMGRDVLHKSPFPDEEIMDIAISRKRIILTGDKKIEKAARKGIETPGRSRPEVWMIEEDLPFDQMTYIIRRAGIDPFERAFTRCSVCNGLLENKKRGDVQGKAPPFVFATVSDYKQCGDCGKLYWAGSHRLKIEKLLRELKMASERE